MKPAIRGGVDETVLLAMPVAAAVAIATGCGGSSDSGSAADTTTAATTATGGRRLGHALRLGRAGVRHLDGAVRPPLAGTYTLTVDDQGTIHNFHLTGPGESMSRPTSAGPARRHSR